MFVRFTTIAAFSESTYLADGVDDTTDAKRLVSKVDDGISNKATRQARVALVSNSDSSFVHFREPLVRALVAAGHEVYVVAPPGRHIDRIQSWGAHFIPWQLNRRSISILREMTSWLSLIRILARIHPHVVHGFTLKANFYTALAAKIVDIPVCIESFTGLGSVFIGQDWRSVMLRRILIPGLRFAFRSLHVTVINPEDEKWLVTHGIVDSSRIHVVPGEGVDVDRLVPTPEPKGPPTAILPARILRDKGVIEFAKAAMLLRRRGVSVRCALVGDVDPGNLTSMSSSWVEGLVASGDIEWWGYQNNMLDVYARASIVCLPSYREGLGMVLVEAMACGRACIATDVPGCRFVVRHGETGLLVPVRNAVLLADAIEMLATSTEQRRMMAQRGRDVAVAFFAIPHVLDALRVVYYKAGWPLLPEEI